MPLLYIIVKKKNLYNDPGNKNKYANYLFNFLLVISFLFQYIFIVFQRQLKSKVRIQQMHRQKKKNVHELKINMCNLTFYLRRLNKNTNMDIMLGKLLLTSFYSLV